jgi:hypothetical protein
VNLLDLAISIQEEVMQKNPDAANAESKAASLSGLREIAELIRQKDTAGQDVVSPAKLAAPFPLCRHVLPSGLRCGSPRLRGNHLYCFFHNRITDRKMERRQSGAEELLRDLPLLEDRAAVKIALRDIVAALVTNEIGEAKARILLSALRIAMQATPLPKQPVEQQPETNVAEDEELGEYVPLTEEEKREQEKLREAYADTIPAAQAGSNHNAEMSGLKPGPISGPKAGPSASLNARLDQRQAAEPPDLSLPQLHIPEAARQTAAAAPAVGKKPPATRSHRRPWSAPHPLGQESAARTT